MKLKDIIINILRELGELFTWKNIQGMAILLNLALIFLSFFLMVWVDFAFVYFFVRFLATLFGLLVLLTIIEGINKQKLDE